LGRQVRPFLARAVHCLEQFLYNPPHAEQEQEDRFTPWDEIKKVSDLFLSVDAFCFPYNKLGQQQQQQQHPIIPVPVPAPLPPPTVLEWPIWCGTIELPLWIPVVSFHGVQRIILQANVVLLTPNFEQKHYLGWDALAGRNSRTSNDVSNNVIELISEAYNFFPTPPMGRLVGVQYEDQQILQQIATRLSDQNTVAILAPSQLNRPSGDDDNRRRLIQIVRIISRRQARERMARSTMLQRMPFAFYVQQREQHPQEEEPSLSLEDDDDDNNDLLCCWEYTDLFQDAILTTATECAPYFKKMILARQKYLSSSIQPT